MEMIQHQLATAQQAARVAGEILVDLQDRVKPREKAPADLVTDADLAAQNAIESRLRQDFPDFDFIGEEGDSGPPLDPDKPCWIVDPLDGTTNYVHGLDNFSVSIALRHGPRIILGVVYDPLRDQMFHAVRSAGAFLNDKRLQVSSATCLGDALVAASFAARVPPESPEVGRFVRVLHRSRAVRRLGSAALNLCYVAAGKLDAYWATSVNVWDVAAGLLCVQEAQGVITSMNGMELDLDNPQFLAACTPALHAEMLSVLSQSDR